MTGIVASSLDQTGDVFGHAGMRGMLRSRQRSTARTLSTARTTPNTACDRWGHDITRYESTSLRSWSGPLRGRTAVRDSG